MEPSSVLQTITKYNRGSQNAAIDLDNLEANIQLALKLAAGKPLRIVTKSIPSVEILRKVMVGTDTKKLLVFGEHIVQTYLDTLPNDTEYLYGHPLSNEQVVRLISHPNGSKIVFLADSLEVLKNLNDVAILMGHPVRVALDFDIGLHRGGVTQSELKDCADYLKSHNDNLEFCGFLGYEGQGQVLPMNLLKEMNFRSSLKLYQEMITEFFSYQPSLKSDTLIVNSGGSRTLSYYRRFGVDFTSDIAVGSIFLLPSDFSSDLEPLGFKAALYFTSPIVRIRKRAQIPFLGAFTYFLALFWSSLQSMYVTLGGGWDAVPQSPDLTMFPLMESDAEKGLPPGQRMLGGKSDLGLRLGDLVLYRPIESSNLGHFAVVLLLKGSQISEVIPVERILD